MFSNKGECEKKSVKKNPSMIEYKYIIGGIFYGKTQTRKNE